MPSPLILILIALALALGDAGFEYMRIQHLDRKIAGLRAENDSLTLANTSYQSMVKVQNASIEDWRAKATHEALATQKAQDLAGKSAQKYREFSDALGRMQGSGDACRDAMAVVDAYYATVAP